MATESNKPTWDNISYEELTERTIKAEKYLSKYPNSEKFEDIRNMYKIYLWEYVSGTGKTPLYDIITSKVNNEVLETYKKIVSKNKETATADAISKYVNMIEENKGIVSKEIAEEANKMFTDLSQNLK